MGCLPEAILELLSNSQKRRKHPTSYTHFTFIISSWSARVETHILGDLEAMLGAPEGARVACYTYHSIAMREVSLQ